MKSLTLLLSALLCAMAAQAEDRPLPSEPKAEITYPSPTAALAALRSKPGVTIREENDWFVVNDPSEDALWSITQPAHPAHPTAVKRTFVQVNSDVRLVMRVKCGASKEVCDRVVEQFKQINENVSKSLRR